MLSVKHKILSCEVINFWSIFKMSNEEMSQDFICLVVGVTAAIVSGVGIQTVKFIRNRWNSKSPKIDDNARKQLQKPSQQSNSSKQDLNVRKKQDVGASPFNVVQLHSDPTESKSKSTSEMMLLDGPKEVDVALNIRKAEDNTNNYDVQMDIVADPESSDPMVIQVDATFDKEMNVANVNATRSEAEGSVKIEGQLENDRKTITLDPKKKDSSSKMVLRKR